MTKRELIGMDKKPEQIGVDSHPQIGMDKRQEQIGTDSRPQIGMEVPKSIDVIPEIVYTPSESEKALGWDDKKSPEAPASAQGARQETPKTQQEAQQETLERSPEGSLNLAIFNPENQGFFGKMSEAGKSLAGKVYEGLYKIPGINRFVGRMEISYNQFWLDRHEAKAVKLKNAMDVSDLKTRAMDEAKREMLSTAENLKKQGLSGSESLMLKIKEIDSKKSDLQTEKDKVHSKFEARDNKMKLYANRRDVIVDKLSGYYSEKLRPIENELEKLNNYKDQTDLLVAVTEAQHNDSLFKLAKVEKNKNAIEEALRKAGQSEKEIKKVVSYHEDLLKSGREKIRKEKAELTKKTNAIKEKIAKNDAEANPYRDKRDEFVRIKEGRPLDIKAGERRRAKGFDGSEDINPHIREEAEKGTETKPEEVEESNNFESVEEMDERLSASDLIARWDAYLTKEKATEGIVNPKEFLSTTTLSEDNKLDLKDFKNILGRYYKLKMRKSPNAKKAMDNFNKNIQGFEKAMEVKN